MIGASGVPSRWLLTPPRYTPPRSQIVSPGRAGLPADSAVARSSGRSGPPLPSGVPNGDTYQTPPLDGGGCGDGSRGSSGARWPPPHATSSASSVAVPALRTRPALTSSPLHMSLVRRVRRDALHDRPPGEAFVARREELVDHAGLELPPEAPDGRRGEVAAAEHE